MVFGVRGTGRGAESGEVHPFVSRLGLATVLDELPVAIYIADERGTIVWRNKRNLAALDELVTARGEAAVQSLRDAILRAARGARSFPHVAVVDASSRGHVGKIEASISALPGAYLVHWRDVTANEERIRALSETADELSETSHAFDVLSARLAAEASAVAERAETVSAGANQLSASITSISSSAAAAAGDTAAAVGAAAGTRDRITELVESSAQIGAVSKLIRSIADQTNLLALNATIEAARAGDAGKGFAVVAGEVKDLAGRTGEATDGITRSVQAIQSGSGSVADSIQQIMDLIGEIESRQSMIAGAVEEQSATASEMSANITAVALSAQSTAQVVAELRVAAEKVLAKSRELHELV